MSHEDDLPALRKRVGELERQVCFLGNAVIGVVGGVCINGIILALCQHAETPVWSVTAIAAVFGLDPRDPLLIWSVGVVAVALTGGLLMAVWSLLCRETKA